jgi:hypothetical protein
MLALGSQSRSSPRSGNVRLTLSCWTRSAAAPRHLGDRMVCMLKRSPPVGHRQPWVMGYGPSRHRRGYTANVARPRKTVLE